MKICAIICEYNPFHNGHLFQLRAAKEQSNADAIVCFMSGNFVQRGEAAIMDKYTRAKHAVLAGADAVIELPTVFATSNAELFAKGGVHLLSSIPAVKMLCFGAENADISHFLNAATRLNDEPKEVSSQIKALTKAGMSYAQARALAFEKYIPMEILTSPNNILGLEYTRAILSNNAKIEILPIQRIGGGYTDTQLYHNLSSASAIREHLTKGESVERNVPDFVFASLPKSIENSLEILEKYAILSQSKAALARVCDCTEGLENAFKKAANTNKPLTESLVSARYTASRIRRIALQSLLKIEEQTIRECLQAPLYLRVLAAKKERTDVLSALSESTFPLLTRAHEENGLSYTARACWQIDDFADSVYRLLYPCFQQKNIFI